MFYLILLIILIIVLVHLRISGPFETLANKYSEVELGTADYPDFSSWGPAVNFSNPSDQNPENGFLIGGTIGMFPAIPLCNTCGMRFNCPNYTFTNQQNVCAACRAGRVNMTDLDKPIYTAARSAGRTRQCRQIVNYRT